MMIVIKIANSWYMKTLLINLTFGMKI